MVRATAVTRRFGELAPQLRQGSLHGSHAHSQSPAHCYPFTFEAVREKVPSASGVYSIYTAERWVYVGESDHIRRSLFRHLNEPSEAMNRFGQQAMIEEFEPACPAEQSAAEAHPEP